VPSPARPGIPLPGFTPWLDTAVMLGFARTDNESLVSCLSDPQRAVPAYHELLRRGKDAVGAIRAGQGDTCVPGADEVLGPALRHLASDPDAHVRAMAAELAGKFVHSDGRAVTALQTARAQDPSPVVRKKAGWFTPGGTIYQRTVPRPPR
jgi:hypothetical protein